MATTIWPSANNVGPAGDLEKLREQYLTPWLKLVYETPVVRSGFTGGTSGTLTVSIAAGELFLDGYRVLESGARTRVLAASTSRDVYYQLTFDGSGNVTGGQLTDVAAGAAAPAHAILLGTATTSAGAITAWVDKRPMSGTTLAGQGTLASRPGAPFRIGRLYWSTDTNEFWRDNGASWDWIGGRLAGTLAGRPAAGNAGRLYWATDSERLYRDNGATWDEVAPGTVLGSAFHRPGASTSYSITNADGDVDSANLAVTFLVPESGSVLVTLEAVAVIDTGSTRWIQFLVRDSSGTLFGERGLVIFGNGGAGRVSYTARVDGLTPGDLIEFRFGARSATSGNTRLYFGTSAVNNADIPNVAPGPASIVVTAA